MKLIMIFAHGRERVGGKLGKMIMIGEKIFHLNCNTMHRDPVGLAYNCSMRIRTLVGPNKQSLWEFCLERCAGGHQLGGGNMIDLG